MAPNEPIVEKISEEKPVTRGEDKQILPKKRRIVIEIDGNVANISIAEVAGNLELSAILQGLLDNMKGRR